MKGRSFFDTNVLVYTDDQDFPEKHKKAVDLFAQCRDDRVAVVSTQVLQEYFVTITRKLHIDIETARRKTEILGRVELVPIQLDDILGAIDLQRLHGFDFWDGLIARAAIISGCTQLFSEDFKHGQRIDSVQVVNPFL